MERKRGWNLESKRATNNNVGASNNMLQAKMISSSKKLMYTIVLKALSKLHKELLEIMLE